MSMIHYGLHMSKNDDCINEDCGYKQDQVITLELNSGYTDVQEHLKKTFNFRGTVKPKIAQLNLVHIHRYGIMMATLPYIHIDMGGDFSGKAK